MNEIEAEKTLIRRRLKRKLKLCVKYKAKCENQLTQAQKWPEVEHEAQLLQAFFFLLKKGMPSVVVKDWNQGDADKTIHLDPLKEPQAQIAERYKSCKKWRKGIPHLESQLDKTNQNMLILQQEIAGLELVTTAEELLPYQTPIIAKKTSPIPAKLLPYHQFISDSGLKIWVGKSAKGNDELTFQHANGSDYWFHVQGMPGSHVVLKVPKNGEPDDAAISDALQLSIFYSKAKNQGEGEVLITQRKYVSKGVQKQPGKVQESKHKNRYIRLDLERITVIKNR